mgnify:CR=1 FL=1
MTDDLDLGHLPPPVDEDAHWAWRLWNSLQIADEALAIEGGSWDMPGVGRYHRTGLLEITLSEIHAPMEPDRLGITVWNKVDWITLLGNAIGWVVVTDQVRTADQEPVDDGDEPALEHIGKVFACPCGMIYSLRGPGGGLLRLKVSEEGNCLNPNCNILIPLPHAGVLNAVDDGAIIAKQEAEEMIAIALDEDDYPLAPHDPVINEVATSDSDEEE